MKRAVIIFTLIVLFLGVYAYNHLGVLERHKSPDGQYELIIKSENMFGFTSPGDGGTSRPVEAILNDANGKVLGKGDDTLWFSIEVRWDIENNQVRYAKGRTINLK